MSVSYAHSSRLFFGTAVLIFSAAASVTIVSISSMAAAGGMSMPGGWTMSMAWMRMPGQTWVGATGTFLGMWVAMMVAMMLPSLVPMLWRYRQAVARTSAVPLGWLTVVVSMAYYVVWTLFGLAAYLLGTALAAVAMASPMVASAVPLMIGIAVVLGGALQFTAWKTYHLHCCRKVPGRGYTLPADVGRAWRHGLRLGLHCTRCCAGLMTALLVIGIMDIRAMSVVAAAIAVERISPAGERAAQAIGVLVVGAGALLIVQAARSG